MPNINITVAGKVATNMSPDVSIICGNADYTVTFDFDEEWSAHPVKTARFVFTKSGKLQYLETAFSGNVAQVPVLSDIEAVYVGVYAGELHTTTPTRVLCKRSILCGGGTHVEPPEDVYMQLMALLGNPDGGGLQFVESTEYPGCYYREVTKTVIDQEGNKGTIVEQEWLNPPMLSSNVYRTTKRHSGRYPVYVTRINLGKLPNSSSKMVDQQTALQHPDGCVDYAMFCLYVSTILKVAPQIYYGESVYTHVDGAEIKASHYGGLYVECYADTTKDLSSYACYVYVEFTATWDY